MISTARTPFVLTGRHVLAMVVGFFAAIVAVDVSFAVIAYRTDPGEVVEKPFEDGLAFNTVIARRDVERRLGWRASITTRPNQVGSRRLVVTLVDGRAAPVRRLRLQGEISRPATEAGRRRLVFDETGPGVYEASAPDTPGAWDLSLKAQAANGAPFEAEARLRWR